MGINRANVQTGSFFFIWIPSVLTFIAIGLASFALNWWLATSPNGGSILGIVAGVGEIFGLFIVVLVSGSIDRSDPQSFLLRTLVLLLLVFLLLLPVFIMTVPALIALIFACIAFLGKETLLAIYQASTETTLANIAPTTWQTSRTALLSQMQSQISRLIAPLIGGVLISERSIWAFPFLCIAIVILCMGGMMKWPVPHVQEVAHTQPKARGISQGELLWTTLVTDALIASRWIRQQKTLIFMLVISVLTNLILYPFTVLLPVFLNAVKMGASALVYSQASAAYGAGLAITTIVLSRFPLNSKRPVFLSSIIVLVIALILGAISFFAISMVVIIGMALLGGLLVALIAIDGGAWLNLTPATMRVRVFSLRRLVSFGSIPLGTILMGVGGSVFGFTFFLRILLVVVVAILLVTWIATKQEKVESNTP